VNLEWNIRSCADHCGSCQRKFEDGESLLSSLGFTAEGYQRADYCLICAEKRAEEAENTQEISSWTAIWRAPAPKTAEPLKKETAETLLREMMETEDPSRRNVIFILAVMLERRRILVEREVQLQPDGGKIRLYEHKQTGESFVVPDPQLKLDEIETVQQEVVELLGMEAPEHAKSAVLNEKTAKNDEKS
jgi:hypothetical protein